MMREREWNNDEAKEKKNNWSRKLLINHVTDVVRLLYLNERSFQEEVNRYLANGTLTLPTLFTRIHPVHYSFSSLSRHQHLPSDIEKDVQFIGIALEMMLRSFWLIDKLNAIETEINIKSELISFFSFKIFYFEIIMSVCHLTKVFIEKGSVRLSKENSTKKKSFCVAVFVLILEPVYLARPSRFHENKQTH